MATKEDRVPLESDPCSIVRTLAVLHNRWSFLILREAFAGTTRFADFRDALGIAPDVLSARLARLVEYGVLQREPYLEPGQRTRYDYRLTPAGSELKVALAALQQWGDDHLPLPDGPTVRRVSAKGRRSLRVVFADSKGNVVGPADATFVRTDRYPSE
jgi:DNA-binding HxlR family transcriptional regulator